MKTECLRVVLPAISGGKHPLMTPFPPTQVDVNDHAPEFEQSVYTASGIRENPIGNVSVIRVRATDADQNANGEVRYSITAGTSCGVCVRLGVVGQKGVCGVEVKVVATRRV